MWSVFKSLIWNYRHESSLYVRALLFEKCRYYDDVNKDEIKFSCTQLDSSTDFDSTTGAPQ